MKFYPQHKILHILYILEIFSEYLSRPGIIPGLAIYAVRP